MRWMDTPMTRRAGERADLMSLCSVFAGGRLFGLETRYIREVLGKRTLAPVPLAPAYISGVVPYRGEVLTAVHLGAVLRQPQRGAVGCVLILDCEESEERFGLVVDKVGAVATFERAQLAANPSTLDEAGRALFDGAFQMADGLMVRLMPERLSPVRLAEMERPA